MLACKHNLLPRVDEACADDAAVLGLSVIRSIASGYMTTDVACWDTAYGGAERVLGPVEGNGLVAAMTGVMRAMRSERAAAWSFLPATCCRVTPHEQDLLGLIEGARRSARADIDAAAARFAGVPAAPRLADAARHAATVLDRVAGLLPTRGTEGARPPATVLH